jgi:hypothetical protein
MLRMLIILAMALSVLLGGCSKPPPANLPTVYKVGGKVVDAAGQPVKGGTLQLQSQAMQNTTAIGDIQPDGTFQMRTMVDGHRLDGVVAGAQKATYFPPMTEDQAAAIPRDLKDAVEIKAQDNDLTIKLP